MRGPFLSQRAVEELRVILVDTLACRMKDLVQQLMSLAGGHDCASDVAVAEVPRWLPGTLQLADILDKMLTLDPEKRMTVGQALKHPWSDTSYLASGACLRAQTEPA